MNQGVTLDGYKNMWIDNVWVEVALTVGITLALGVGEVALLIWLFNRTAPPWMRGSGCG
jgi:hypothetical protein